MAQEMGIVIDQYRPSAAEDFAPRATETGQERTQEKTTGGTAQSRESAQRAGKAAATANYSDYYRECRERITDPAAVAYLQQRGISMDTANAYWLGFDPAADPAGAPGATGDTRKAHPCPRLIIPINGSHYIARRIDGESLFKAMNPAGSEPGIFNEAALFAQEVQEIFVTEGAIDALSIIEAGAAAVALNSAANADKLINLLTERRTAATLILCLDNDDRGRKATETIRAGLQRLNVSYICADVCGGHKDPNEALQADRGAFIEAVAAAKRQGSARPDNTAYYLENLMSGEIERFKDDKKTGFKNLDKQSGGLYCGLYVLAAISSLGKTSFALQLADQLAAGGHDVVFFSLEQSRLELVSKSLARITYQNDPAHYVTSLQIRRGNNFDEVQDAKADYIKKVADRLSIVEGNFSCNVSFIGDYIRQYVRKTGTKPVVFLDYLQILQPAEDAKRQTVKETVDNTVTELKRISRELDLTIILISSVNRANYLTPIDFESLKESGGIEFTADVIWGLQLQCLNDPIFDKQNNIKERREKIKAAKAAEPRKIELCCLKNRYGIANFSCYFDYYPANDLFRETSSAEIDFTTTPKAGRKL
jgi:replicative DNA helicase